MTLSTTKLPVPALLAMTMTVFIGCLTEVLPAGLLLGMARDLDVSASAAGQLVTVYAVTTALTAIPLTTATLRVPRKTLLVALVLGFLVTNVVIALSPWYWLVLLTRIVSGAITGLMWSLVACYAMRICPPGQSGRGLALAMSGTPVGFAVGVPAGTALGELGDWRFAFAAMALITACLLAWVVVAVPPLAADTTAPVRPGQALGLPGMRAVLLVVLLFSLGHNVAYTYVAPLLVHFGQVGLLSTLLLVFGAAAVVGLLLVGVALDRGPRAVLLACCAVTAAGLVVLGLSGGAVPALLVAAAVWGLAFGGAPTAFQAVTARIAGPTADAAQSLTIAAWNGAVAAGAGLGGLLLPAGALTLPWTAALLVGLALLVRPGDRGRLPG